MIKPWPWKFGSILSLHPPSRLVFFRFVSPPHTYPHTHAHTFPRLLFRLKNPKDLALRLQDLSHRNGAGVRQITFFLTSDAKSLFGKIGPFKEVKEEGVGGVLE